MRTTGSTAFMDGGYQVAIGAVVVVALVAAICAVMWSVITDAPVGCLSNEARKFAILREVKDRIEDPYLGNQQTPDETVAALRAWAKTLPDRCVRGEYLRWIAFFDGDNKRRRATDAVFRDVERVRLEIPKPPTR